MARSRTRTITRYVARPRSRSRRNGGVHIPLAVVAGFFPIAAATFPWIKQGNLTQAGYEVLKDFTGYNVNEHRWDFVWLKNGMLPVVLGMVAHKLANRFGVNRAIARAGIPLVRI